MDSKFFLILLLCAATAAGDSCACDLESSESTDPCECPEPVVEPCACEESSSDSLEDCACPEPVVECAESSDSSSDCSDSDPCEDVVCEVCEHGYASIPPDPCKPVCTVEDCCQTCKKVVCDPAVAPINGKITTSNITVGGETTVECDDGYELSIGLETRVCELAEDGLSATYAGEAPGCTPIPTCDPPLTAPEHGSISAAVTAIGSDVTAACDAGFKLTGTATRVCERSEDGITASWSGDPAICVDIECDPATSPTDGALSSVTIVTVGSVVDVTCNEGYELEGDTTYVCTLDEGGLTATFVGSATCIEEEKGPKCELITAPEHGTLSEDKVNPGESMTVTCDKGYKLEGTKTRVCTLNEDGTASYNGLPAVCVKIPECEPIKAPENGQVSTDKINIGDTMTVTCNEGFLLVGNAIRHCIEINGEAMYNGTTECKDPCEDVTCEECPENWTKAPKDDTCCPYTCVDPCDGVECASECAEGEKLVDVEGDLCCAQQCVVDDCADVVCPEECPEGEMSVATSEEDECCELMCVLDPCYGTECAADPCPEGLEKEETPDAVCCDHICVDPCATVQCEVQCEFPFVEVPAEPGQCCSHCADQCADVACDDCPDSFEIIPPAKGQCCHTCKDPCGDVDCPMADEDCGPGLMVTEESSACCETTCVPDPCFEVECPTECPPGLELVPVDAADSCCESKCIDPCEGIACDCGADMVALEEVEEGVCCPACVDPCTLVECEACPDCTSEGAVPEGECCPACEPDPCEIPDCIECGDHNDQCNGCCLICAGGFQVLDCACVEVPVIITLPPTPLCNVPGCKVCCSEEECCECDVHLILEDGACVPPPVNPCEDGSHTCAAVALCVAGTDTNYQCVCPPGHHSDDGGKTCALIPVAPCVNPCAGVMMMPISPCVNPCAGGAHPALVPVIPHADGVAPLGHGGPMLIGR